MTDGPIILDKLERINMGKLTGALLDTELKDELILAADEFRYAKVTGKTNEDATNFKSYYPKKNIFKFPHKELDVAHSTMEQTLGVAEMELDDREILNGGKQKSKAMDEDLPLAS